MAENLFVLGHPVAHSKSPAMHNAAYRALGLDWEYGFADCPTEGEARVFLARRDWLAINITMPWKPLALEASTARTDEARLANGANVLVRRGDDLLADNTDGKGCVAYLRRCGVEFAGARAVVCGTGPTSLAIMHAVASAGASHVALLGRDDAKTRRALADYHRRGSGGIAAAVEKTAAKAGGLLAEKALESFKPTADLIAGSYSSSADLIERADIILDATPLGMSSGDPAPFDTTLLSSRQIVFDVVYAHGKTALLAAARAVGCAAYDGSGMLVAQAVETVRDIVEWLDMPVNLAETDLFDVMAKAAGFDA